MKHTIDLPEGIYRGIQKLAKLNIRVGKKVNIKYKIDHAAELLGHIQRKSWYRLDWNSYPMVTLHSEITKSVTTICASYFRLLEEHGLIKIDNYFCKGIKSKSYKFNDKFINDVPVTHTYTDTCILKRLNDPSRNNKYSQPLNAQATYQLNMLKNNVTIDLPAALGWIANQNYRPQKEAMITRLCNKLSSNDVYLIQSKHGRRHHNITSMPSYIRNNFIQIDGQPIVEIDISNSQPRFLLEWLHYYEYNYTIPSTEMGLYASLIASSSLYEYFQEQWEIEHHSPITRDQAKLLVYKVFFDRPREKPSKSLLTNHNFQCLFAKLFPAIYDCMVEYGNKKLAGILQKIESKYVFGKASNVMCNYFTVHDSIYVPKTNYNEYKDIWL